MKRQQWDFHHYLQRNHVFSLVYTSSNLKNIAIVFGGVHVYFEDVLVRICIFFLISPFPVFYHYLCKKEEEKNV